VKHRSSAWFARHSGWLMACCTSLGGAVAEAQQTPAASNQNDAALQEIVVTGTLIRGTGPVGSAVIAMDQTDLQDTGGNTVVDMLREIPQVSTLGVSEASRSGTGGAGNITYGNSINIRGISPFATLTLVDSHRVPAAGTTGATVDPDSFPSIMLQRVDIVADGASATYGSDAIAGVANLILRRDVEGVEASARKGWADNYDERQLGIVAGHNWGSGQFTLGYENSYHSNLNGENRSFFASDQTSRGGNNYSSLQCNPGNIEVGGVTYAIPAGGVTPATAALLVPGTANRCDPSKNEDLLPEVEHNDVAFTLDQKFNDAISLFGDASYSRRTFTVRNAQSTGPLQVPNTNAFYVAPPGTAGAPSEQVDYFFGPDVGNNSYNVGQSENYQGTLGVDIKLGHDWRLEIDGTGGRDHDHALDPTHSLDNGALGAALASGNPATALNVFGGANSPAVLKSVFDTVFYAPADSGEQVLETKLDGPVAHLPGGDLRVALGAQWRHEQLDYGLFSGVPGGPGLVLDHDLGRHESSAFAEFLVPLVGPDNAAPGLQRLELDVAVRHEDYSDFGSTTHPKIGINWTPLEGLLVHASYGTSFRAPQLSELVGPLKGVFVQTYADPQSANGTSVGYTLGGGNTALRPETATTYSFGVDYAPVEHAKLSLNYFNIDYKNQISSYLSDLTILQQVEQLGSLITRCPSAACTSLVNQYVTPGPVFGPILANPSVFVNGQELNLGTTRTAGLDFQGTYKIPTPQAGQFSVGLAGTVFTQYSAQFTPGGPSFNELNTIGYPLKLRMRGSFGWQGGPLRAMAFVNYENSYTNTQVTPNQSVSAYTTVDLNVVYDLGKQMTQAWARDLTFTVHVNNVFDTDPPYVNIPISPNGGGGFDPNVASPIGRLVSLAIGKKF